MASCGLDNGHVFITGGAGFIGSATALRLAGANRVTVYDNLQHGAVPDAALLQHPNITLIEGDVLDADGLAWALEPSVTYVLHCAAIAGVPSVLRNPLPVLRVNLLGTLNVLEAAARLPRLRRLLDFSTSEVYGQQADRVSEGVVR